VGHHLRPAHGPCAANDDCDPDHRDGYTRASIDAISAEAGVSTRTIYNHFTDKAMLSRP